MLKLLTIANIAVISKLQVEFEKGLTLLTGETGSGKSIIIDSLNLLLGTRASQEIIRTGEETARVEALFLIPLASPIRKILEEAGIDWQEEELIIRREISTSGRSKIFINNSLATLSTLREIGSHLVDIHGQHDGQFLLNSQCHLELLDLFGENQSLVDDVAESYRRVKTFDQRLRALQMDEQQRLKQIDILSFQVGEIEKAKLSEDLDKELLAERNILLNTEKLYSLTSESFHILYDSETAVLTNLKKVSKHLEELSQIDSHFQAYQAQLENVRYQMEDLAYYVRDYTEGIQFNQAKLDQIENRLSEIDKLRKKYGQSIADILKYLESIKAELNELSMRKEREEETVQQLDAALRDYLVKAKALSEKRRGDAQKLEAQMRQELNQLAMEATHFKVSCVANALSADTREDGIGTITAKGIDEVEFLAATNKGEALKPLVKVASGGELSRIILALKTLVAADSPGKTLIFDEVDAGIGGRVAEVVGKKLKRVAKAHQVLCITHLPQIASFADQHYFVYKEVRNKRTEAFIERLEEKRRVDELARMLGGERITETTTKHAKEMLKLADSTK